ncbi:glycosyltransferase [Ktedonobacter robiniae]|nr:glycosyltransferase [Ktedonobacter robiniae]
MMTLHQYHSPNTDAHIQSIAVYHSQGRPQLPRLSIILCTYNRRNLVLSALSSLHRQTLPPHLYEVIVVDNGSNDGTIEAIQNYLQSLYDKCTPAEKRWQARCISEPQNGLAYARNTGLAHARGEIAVFMDDDSIADANLLESLLLAYHETNADAIGGRVDIRWEGDRPYWLSDELLDVLGYFSPFGFEQKRLPMPPGLAFSNCCFSVKIKSLRKVGLFSPYISKRLHSPTNLDVEELCQRLRQHDCQLWYEPQALVFHRAPIVRLQKAFFLGRAYWQGRAEILARYACQPRADAPAPSTTRQILLAAFMECLNILNMAYIQRPLIVLAHKPTSEYMMAAMERARAAGRLRQLIQALYHAPAEITLPSVLFVYPNKEEQPRVLDYLKDEVPLVTKKRAIPLNWLWRHRAYQQRSIGVVHIYQPGAFKRSWLARRRLLFSLWVARLLGITIVATDAGGWWHNFPGRRARKCLEIEHTLLSRSNAIQAFTRQPQDLYAEKELRQRTYGLSYPGSRGANPPLILQEQARKQLGLTEPNTFIYLCHTHLHTESEVLQLIQGFQEVQQEMANREPEPLQLHLLLAGPPVTKRFTRKLKRIAYVDEHIHVYPQAREADLPLYMGACNAVIFPHRANISVGNLHAAIQAASYDRLVIAPTLPRYQGMLPLHAGIYYQPESPSSLSEALQAATRRHYHPTTDELQSLDSVISWRRYAQELIDLYKKLIFH